ncbi:MAG: hypothetical protein Q9209_000151 [Squamulea sp. 1 TL-2023]
MNKIRFHLPLFTILLLQLLFSTLISATGLRCWAPEASPRRLIFKECKDIILHQIDQTRDFSRRPFDPALPLTFSRDRDPRPDIRTPKTWFDETGQGDCLIGVDIPRHLGGSDKTSLDDIKAAAMTIAVECVIQDPRHLGGVMQLGWANKLTVLLTSIAEPSRNIMAGRAKLNGTSEEA